MNPRQLSGGSLQSFSSLSLQSALPPGRLLSCQGLRSNRLAVLPLKISAPSCDDRKKKDEKQHHAVEHAASHLCDGEGRRYVVALCQGGAYEDKHAQEGHIQHNGIGKAVQQVGPAVGMEPGPLADLILDLSKGRHGRAGHSSEDQSGDGDARHHGHLGASRALSEAAPQDCLRDPVQDACRREHTHDAIHVFTARTSITATGMSMIRVDGFLFPANISSPPVPAVPPPPKA